MLQAARCKCRTQKIDIWGLPYRPPFTDDGQIWCARADPRSTRTRQKLSKCVHCVGFWWPKTIILGKFWLLGGLLYRSTFTDEGQIWCAIADPWSTHMCQISSRSVYSVALCWRKTPMFALFWTSAFSGVTNKQQSEKVEHRCTTTNLPLSNGIKIVSVLQGLHDEIGRIISDFQKRDEQTNRQPKKTLTFLAATAAGKSEPHQTWHSDRGPRARSCTLKAFGVWRTVSPLGGAENLGITRPRQLKTPITP